MKRTSLPRTLRITEVDLHASIDSQTGVLCHLGSLITGQQATELFKQSYDGTRDGVANSLRAMTGESRSVLHPLLTAVSRQAGKMQQHVEPHLETPVESLLAD